jgi:hypothetical protein
MKIHRSINEPLIMKHASWEERWKGVDEGLIASWERGREMAAENADLALQACAGRLIVLPWKGGFEPDPKKKTQPKEKDGSLWYLAMWQGLRGEDLKIDTDEEVCLNCTETKIRIFYNKEGKKRRKDRTNLI